MTINGNYEAKNVHGRGGNNHIKGILLENTTERFDYVCMYLFSLSFI